MPSWIDDDDKILQAFTIPIHISCVDIVLFSRKLLITNKIENTLLLLIISYTLMSLIIHEIKGMYEKTEIAENFRNNFCCCEIFELYASIHWTALISLI